MLVDQFGREVSGVRVSLTDRCNFDCVYCHNEGLGDTRGPMEPRNDEMSTDDVVRFLEVAREFDVDAVKFTGGEPMLRDDLEEIVRRTPDGMETSLTTNGTYLPGRAPDLVDAGLDRVNVSQDALDQEAFARVTQSGEYEAVIEGVEAALDAGLKPVKLNMVVFEQTAGYVPEMVDHVAENDGLQLQLIEYMPELAGRPEWAVDIQRVHDWLEEQADHIEQRDMHDRRRYWVGGSPASSAERSRSRDGDAVSRDDENSHGEFSNHSADHSSGQSPREDEASGTSSDESDGNPDDDAGGMVEIVDPVGNADFCANCHRVRVTHEGYLKGCLNRNDDLRSMGEMSRAEIREAFHETVHERVPYYGEYMIKDDDGEWTINEEYIGV